MSARSEHSSQSLALLTDLYQLTMAQGYWKLGRANEQAVFHLYFRSPPFHSGYTVAAGLAPALAFIDRLRFDATDIEYLRSLSGNDSKPLFDDGFLLHLSSVKIECDIDAMAEGTVVFPGQPIVRVTGPMMHCQLLETPLLNIINFQTLIATKAARVTLAARGDAVIEFGLRRAQGVDGGLSASRAAYVGGCAATSNVLAGKKYGIPVRGTHAHSWVMSFDSELESFEAYAAAMPNNCVFLVDTYDTIEGVRHAVRVGKRLREAGHELAGIRLDSGDLAYLSVQARLILDDGGFKNTAILGSNDLDEHIISSLKEQGAQINVWGVGTKLVTGGDSPALGGVYKLGAIRSNTASPWRHKLKISEQTAKTTTPGMLQTRRFSMGDQFAGDMLYDELTGAPDDSEIVDPLDPIRTKRMPSEATWTDLLERVMTAGKRTGNEPTLAQSRGHTLAQLGRLHTGIKRLLNPHQYPAGMARNLFELRRRLIETEKLSEQRDPSDTPAQRPRGT